MPPCDPSTICVDAFDDRRFREQVIQLLTALLDSTATSDYEFLLLCDVDGVDVTPFIRQITIECDGTKVVEDFELDAVTPYTVSDPANVTVCAQSQGVIDMLCLPELTEFPTPTGINCIANIVGHSNPAVSDGLYIWNGVTWVALFTD